MRLFIPEVLFLLFKFIGLMMRLTQLWPYSYQADAIEIVRSYFKSEKKAYHDVV